jgi:predicted PurR-regulated permease PerM
VVTAISASSVAGMLGSGLLGFGKFLVSSVYKASIVVVLTLYFMGTLPSIRTSAYQLVPASRRERVGLLGDEVLSRIGGYVSGALVVATCAGLTSWAMLAAVGAPYALPLSMVIGATDLVPLVGALIAIPVASAGMLIIREVVMPRQERA